MDLGDLVFELKRRVESLEKAAAASAEDGLVRVSTEWVEAATGLADRVKALEGKLAALQKWARELVAT